MSIQKKRRLQKLIHGISLIVLTCLLTFICAVPAMATTISDAENAGIANTGNAPGSTGQTDDDAFNLNISSNAGSTNLSATLQILLALTVLSIAPSILLMMTSFTRIVIVMHFVRSALGTQSTPPNQVMIGLSLFLTFFLMSPVFSQINTDAIQPLQAGEMTQEEAIDAGLKPMREFMFDQMSDMKDIKLFLEIAGIDKVESIDDIPTTTLVPAFMISELTKAFTMGFLIYLPFIVIDMVVASTLMSMGMMMLPPTTISMPFKILLFIMADGWNLIIGEVVRGFH